MSQRIFPITMPKWGIEMQQGTITQWHAEPGQTLAKGDTLLDVETEKIVNSVEAPIAGTLRRILADVECHGVCRRTDCRLCRSGCCRCRGRCVHRRLQACRHELRTGRRRSNRQRLRRHRPRRSPATAQARSARSPGGWPTSSASTSRRSRARAAMAACRKKTSKPTPRRSAARRTPAVAPQLLSPPRRVPRRCVNA